MTDIQIRNLPENTYRTIEARAKAAKRTTEAEIRLILEEAVQSKPLRLGSLLAEIGRQAGGVELDIARDKTFREPVSFE